MEQLYFLSRPDQWYMGRINRALSDPVKLYVVNALKARVNVDVNKGMIPHYIQEWCSTFFSRRYNLFDKLIKSELLLAKDSLPNEEQIADFFEIGNELFRFVEAIRERAQFSLDDITDSEIDKLFLEAYKDKERFSALCLDFSRATIELLKPPTEVGAFPEEELDELEKRFKFDECTLPYINRQALHSL